jgi:hypothetical protein
MSIQEVELEIPEDQIPEELGFREAPRVAPPVQERLAIEAPPKGRHHAADSSAAEDKPKRPVGRPPGSGKKQNDPPTPPLKIRPPDFSEWHDYLGDFALKWAWRGYVAFAFRGIDRYELLSPSDNEALELDPEELADIAKPIAHLADRSKFGKRYGRVIIDSSDGVAAMIQLGMAAGRVNRIARKYREGTSGVVSSAAVGGEIPGEAPESESGNVHEFPGARATGYGYN